MLTVFARADQTLHALDPAIAELPEAVVWIDMTNPSPEEVRFIERGLGIDMPTREEMREIEASARVYEEDGGAFMTARIPYNADNPPPAMTEITFILVRGRLITLRFADPLPFRVLQSRIGRIGPTLGSDLAVFFWLIDAVIARLADIVERTGADLDGLSSRIFRSAASPAKERVDLVQALAQIGRNGDTMSSVRESLHTLQHMLIAVAASDLIPDPQRKDARTRAKTLNRDVSSLAEHAGFVANKISLLLDATLGLINIEQSNIIKIFSVLAGLFLPPTLIASVYGMNFRVMPELDWALGYPFALVLMLLTAVVPLWYFRRKRWL